MRGQRHASAAPYPRERPGTQCTGGWVGLRASLDWCGKSRPTGIRSPDRPARRQSLYRLRYPAHLIGLCTACICWRWHYLTINLSYLIWKVRLRNAHFDITFSVHLDLIKLVSHHSNKSILIYKNTIFFAATCFGVTSRHPKGTLQQDWRLTKINTYITKPTWFILPARMLQWNMNYFCNVF